jgi:hypothetical protein
MSEIVALVAGIWIRGIEFARLLERGVVLRDRL